MAKKATESTYIEYDGLHWKLAVIPLTKLHKNPAQPGLRTTEHNLKALLAALKKSGLGLPIAVTPSLNDPSEYDVIEGWRRTTLRQKDEKKDILCIVVVFPHPVNLPVLWSYLSIARAHVSEDRLAAHEGLPADVRGQYFDTLPRDLQRKINRCRDIFGEERLRELAAVGLSPDICIPTKWLHDHLTSFPNDSKDRLPPVNSRQVAEWILKHEKQNDINRLKSLYKNGSARAIPATLLRNLYKAVRDDQNCIIREDLLNVQDFAPKR